MLLATVVKLVLGKPLDALDGVLRHSLPAALATARKVCLERPNARVSQAHGVRIIGPHMLETGFKRV
jgi:hypothetical protein